jgi:hypothetical protein
MFLLMSENATVSSVEASAFALLLETACEEFEILQDLIKGDLLIDTPDPRTKWDSGMKGRKQVIRGARSQSAIQMALAKSFVFNARRANRVCTLNKAAIPLDRDSRKLFLRDTNPLIAVRDVNEHGFDGNGSSKPSMHEHEGGLLDETSMVILGSENILMGPLNLFDIYAAVDRARKIAGFDSMASTPTNQ